MVTAKWLQNGMLLLRAAESTVVMAQTAKGVAAILGTFVPVIGCHHRSKVGTVSLSY
jgi:hypothetical protein